MAVYHVVMSQQPSLVNCGDYIALVSQQNDVRYILSVMCFFFIYMLYGIAVFKLQDDIPKK